MSELPDDYLQRFGGLARLYGAAGFRMVEEIPGRRWGVDVIEEKHELELPRPEDTTGSDSRETNDPA